MLSWFTMGLYLGIGVFSIYMLAILFYKPYIKYIADNMDDYLIGEAAGDILDENLSNSEKTAAIMVFIFLSSCVGVIFFVVSFLLSYALFVLLILSFILFLQYYKKKEKED